MNHAADDSERGSGDSNRYERNGDEQPASAEAKHHAQSVWSRHRTGLNQNRGPIAVDAAETPAIKC